MKRTFVPCWCWIGTLGFGLLCPAKGALTQLELAVDRTYTGHVAWGGGEGFTYLTAIRATPVNGERRSEPAGSFYTFCLDIASDLKLGGWWDSQNLPMRGAENGNSVHYIDGGIQRAASLYNHYVTDVNFSNSSGKREGAALQLAIWEVLYDRGAGGYDVRKGVFHVTGADQSVTSLANIMLTSAFNVPDYNFTSTFWNATDRDGYSICNQDLIGPCSVPEPATFSAFGAILACGYFVGRKFLP